MQRFQERAGESLVWGLLETFINSFSAFVSNLSLQFCGYESFVWAMGLDFTPRIVPPIFFPIILAKRTMSHCFWHESNIVLHDL